MALQVAHHVENALGQAAGSLTGKTLSVSVQEGAAAPAVEEPIVWQQSFSVLDGPCFWIAAGKELWEALGRLTLEAAGLEEVTDADCRSTWQEIVNQTMAGVASGITGELGREITVAKGQEMDAEPVDLAWVVFSVSDEAGKTWAFKAAWTPELTAAGESRVEEVRPPAVRDNSVSKTFDLLLDVALPVSVSFGKTSLQIREVLKLNTGSIVELDRFVTDPVEVIVNNCVIARGEVVVVEGNYGVRIHHLASRDERLRSGMAEAMHRTGVGKS
jgi:flagellar motor switch protein FliN/FliY